MVIELDYPISLRKIAESGQCFRLVPNRLGYSYGTCDMVQTTPTQILATEDISHLFKTDINYSVIEKFMYEKDNYLRKCVAYGKGLRVIEQPIFETIISFIISQNNNIPRITRTIASICPHKTFPTREELLMMSLEDWEEVGAGYRATYLVEAVKRCDEYFISILTSAKTTQDKIDILKSLKGVGDKVANCIALFGLGCYDAFPVDVWMRRIIDTEYDGYFDTQDFKEYRGIVQQFMFYYGRSR